MFVPDLPDVPYHNNPPPGVEYPKDVVNPYMHAFERLPGDWFDRFRQRYAYVALYAWAIPNDRAIGKCVEWGPIVEMGAGMGYWACMIQQAGGDIVAYDSHPKRSDNRFHREDLPEWAKDLTWFGVIQGGPNDLRRHDDRTLLLCWPPYAEPFAADCLDNYAGKRLIFIGEDDGGCTGDTDLFDKLKQDWKLVEVVDIPCWPGIHDAMYMYERTDR